MRSIRPHTSDFNRGFTLLEMTIVIGILIALMSMGFISSRGIKEWQAGKEASETLRSVYVAQRTYLADHPTTPVNTLTQAQLLPYLPTRVTTFPTVKDLAGNDLTIRVTVSPPVVVDSGGLVYDPSGKPNDSLWDVGKQ